MDTMAASLQVDRQVGKLLEILKWILVRNITIRILVNLYTVMIMTFPILYGELYCLHQRWLHYLSVFCLLLSSHFYCSLLLLTLSPP